MVASSLKNLLECTFYFKINGLNMQKAHQLQFKCLNCQKNINFSIFELEKCNHTVPCTQCQKTYNFDDETFRRQLSKFEKLCLQIHESEEILSTASIGIYLGDREIKIPYKLLLSRLNSTLDLFIGDEPLTIQFRIEPTLDLNHLTKNA